MSRNEATTTSAIDAETVADHLEGARGLLVALDFDGTLAPVTDDPKAAELPDETRAILEAMVERDDVLVAVVSGRALSDLRDRVDVAGVHYIGNHGFEHAVDGEIEVLPSGDAGSVPIDDAREEIERRLADVPGAHVEDKNLTATVHYRKTPAEQVDAVRDVVEDVVAQSDGLKTTDGKEIVEVRPTIEWDKGHAVEWLAEDLPDGWQTVYIGDDTTDEDVFAVLTEDDLGVVVGEHDSAASHRVTEQTEVRTLLTWLTDNVLPAKTS